MLMQKLYEAAGTIVSVSILCMLFNYISPHGRTHKSIDVIIGLVYMITVTEAIISLL